MLAVRTHDHVLRGVRLFRVWILVAGDLHVREAIRAVPSERHESAPPFPRVDAVRILAEVRPPFAAIRRDRRRVPSVGRNPHEVHRLAAASGRREILLARLARPAHDDDPFAVGRVDRLGVERRHTRQLLRLPARRRHAVHLAARLIRPRHVRDVTAVGRPRGLVLADVHGRDAPRFAAGIIHDPDAVERGERQLLSVRRQRGIPDLLRAHRSLIDRVLESDPRSDLFVDVRAERNGRRLARRDVHAPDLSFVRRDERARVRRERRAGHQIAVRRRFLIVALNRIDQPRIVAGLQVAHPKAGLRIPACRVHEPLAVGRQHRPHRAPQLVAHAVVFAGEPVVQPQLPAERHLVVDAARVRALGEVDVPVVLAERRAERVELPAFFAAGQVDARAAVHVVQPQLDALRRAARFRDDDILAVRRPLGREVADVLALGERLRIAAVGVGNPDVLVAAAVGQEDDLRSVR